MGRVDANGKAIHPVVMPFPGLVDFGVAGLLCTNPFANVATPAENPVVSPQLDADADRNRDHRHRLHGFYTAHAADRLGNVDTILAKYKGNETQLFEKLATKYNATVPAYGLSASPAQAKHPGAGMAATLSGTWTVRGTLGASPGTFDYLTTMVFDDATGAISSSDDRNRDGTPVQPALIGRGQITQETFSRGLLPHETARARRESGGVRLQATVEDFLPGHYGAAGALLNSSALSISGAAGPCGGTVWTAAGNWTRADGSDAGTCQLTKLTAAEEAQWQATRSACGRSPTVTPTPTALQAPMPPAF
jgi:hypothetical protein